MAKNAQQAYDEIWFKVAGALDGLRLAFEVAYPKPETGAGDRVLIADLIDLHRQLTALEQGFVVGVDDDDR